MKRLLWSFLLTATAVAYQATARGQTEPIDSLLARIDRYRILNPVEKLYLHLDKRSYTVGETIWFKAYSAVGIENFLSNISNIAYAELIDPKENIVESIRIPLVQGVGIGDFTLQDTLIEGTYRLRAYTNWMRNDSASYFFSENIQISNGRADNVLTNSYLAEDGNYVVEMQDMRGIGLADETIEYTITRDGKRLRTGRSKTNALGKVAIPFRNSFAGAKLSLLFKNPERSLVEKIFKLPAADILKNSIQFFPEGGTLPTGVLNRIAAKSLRPDGLGIQSRTEMITNTGDTVAILETNVLGMGSVSLPPLEADSLIAYTIFDDGTRDVTSLPLHQEVNYSLEINNMHPDRLFAQLRISPGNQTGEPIYFVVHYLGKIYYAAAQSASKDALLFSAEKKDLPIGVLTMTFLNHRLEPLAERPIFNYDTANLMPLVIEAIDGASFGTRQKVNVTLETGRPQDSIRNAFLSASVINRSKLQDSLSGGPAGIIASLLLSNDIKGYLENPGFYFREDGTAKLQDIDDLLMTQGWRKIDVTGITDPSTPPVYAAEKGITVKGQARKLFRKAPVPHANMVLIPTHNFLGFIDTVADAEGFFEFDPLFFPDSINFLVTARDAKGDNRIEIILEEETIPAVGPNRNAPGERNNVNALFAGDIRNSKEYFSELESQGMMERGITLREVVITARQEQNKASEYSANLNGRGNADQVISAEELSSCATLEMCLSGRLLGVIFRDGVPYNTRTNGEMQVILDGMYIESSELWMINPANVESVEVLRNINYTAVYGSYGTNGVLIITSKVGMDANERPHTPKGIATVQPKGLHVNKTFYKPIYEPDSEVLFDRDLRTTIHWEPRIITDSSGNATFDFYTADEPGEYLITVEGLDFNGRPGRKTILLQVR